MGAGPFLCDRLNPTHRIEPEPRHNSRSPVESEARLEVFRPVAGFVSQIDMDRIEDANADIGRLEREARLRQTQQSHQAQLIQATDEMITELEELNVKGSDRVPAVLRRRAEAVLSTVPPGEEPLEVRYRVDAMMEVLYRAQELLFRQRPGGQRLPLPSPERIPV